MSYLNTITSLGSRGLDVAAARKQAKLEEDISLYNAEIAEQEAVSVEETGKVESGLALDALNRELSRQTALYGTSGVQQVGTPMDVQAKTAEIILLDSLTRRSGRTKQASELRSEAEFSRFEAEAAKKAGKLRMFRSVMGGAKDVTSAALTSRRAKAPTSSGFGGPSTGRRLPAVGGSSRRA